MRLILICIALTGALVSPALAHTGVGATSSFASGIAHPLHGADHILAMIAVGLWGMPARRARDLALAAWPSWRTMLAGFAAATSGLADIHSWSLPSRRPSIIVRTVRRARRRRPRFG